MKAAIAVIPSSRTSVHQQLRDASSSDLEIAFGQIHDLWCKLFAKFCVRQKFGSCPEAPVVSASTAETASAPTAETAAVDGEGTQESKENVEGVEDVDDSDAMQFAAHVKGHQEKVPEEFSEPCAFADKKVLPYLPYAFRVALIYFADLITLSVLEKRLQQDPEADSEDQKKLRKIRVLALLYSDALTDIAKCPAHPMASRCISMHLTFVAN